MFSFPIRPCIEAKNCPHFGRDRSFGNVEYQLSHLDERSQDRSGGGARPEWPLLLSWMLDFEFHRGRQFDRPYTGPRVLIDRTLHNCDVTVAEKRATYGPCHRCWQEADGCLWIGDTPIWLLSYEVPNQLSEKKRCADLVGVLEGLDYLSCLTTTSAFERLTSEFLDLKSNLPVPPGFQTVTLNPAVTPIHYSRRLCLFRVP